MTSANAPNRSGRRLPVLLSLVLLLPLGAYWFSPLWLPALITELANRQGLAVHQLQLRRPAWNHWQVDRAVGDWDGVRIDLRDLSISYAWRQLLAGRLQNVAVTELDVRFEPAAGAVEQNPASPPVQLQKLLELPAPADWLSRLPWQNLAIQSLAFTLPDYGTTVTGRVRQQSAQLSVEARIISEDPALSRELRLSHSDDDVLSVRLLAAHSKTPVLEATLHFAQSALDYGLSSTLMADDAALLLEAFGYPRAQANVELDLHGQLPKPLPSDFTSRDLALAGRYALSVSDTAELLGRTQVVAALSLSGLSGTFALAAGTLKAEVASGNLSFAVPATAGTGRCAVAAPLALIAAPASLKLSEGIECQLQDPRRSAQLTLLDLEYQTPGQGQLQSLALSLAYSAAIDHLRPAGELQLQISQDADSTITGSGILSVEEDRLIIPGRTGHAAPLPFTVLLWPGEGRGELRFDHKFQIADRILAAISKETPDGLDLGRARLSYEGHLRWRPDTLSAALKGQFAGLKILLPAGAPKTALDPQPLTGAFTLRLADAELELEGVLRPGALTLPVRGRYDLKQDRGTVTIDVADTLTPSTLNGLFLNWPETYALTGGRLTGALSLKLVDRAPEQLAGRLQLNSGTVRYEDYRLLGVSSELDLEWLPRRLLATSDRVRVQQVDLGFPITDLKGALRFESTTTRSWLRFADVQTQLLGGTARNDGFDIDLNTLKSSFAIQLEGIELAELVALEGEEISGTGSLDGRLPIELSDQGVRIRGGELVSRPPGGVIRLSEKFATPTGEPGLDFALTALNDFTYDSLVASVNYEPDGELALGVRLRGRNPRVENGRQINYNVNVSENVPALLKSLKADRLITDEVERQVNR